MFKRITRGAKENLKDPKTTVTGLALMALTILKIAGVITDDQRAQFADYIPQFVPYVVPAFASLILMFKSRDSEKPNPKS